MCAATPVIANGYISNGRNNVGMTREISCSDGFKLEGNETIQCLNNGTWSQPGLCVRQPRCGASPEVSHGHFLAGSNYVGSTRQLNCEPGYRVEWSSQIVCLEDGSWSFPGSCSQVQFTTNSPVVAS